MGYLTDVNVTKIAFVKRAANKRKFLLLKSDGVNVNDSNNNEETYKPMRKEVREFLIKMLKSAESVNKSVEDIVKLVKEDSTLKLADDEVQEVTDFASFSKETAPEVKEPDNKEKDKKVVNKSTDNGDDNKDNTVSISKKQYEEMQSTMTTLQDTIKKMTHNTERRELVSWLEKECPFLPADNGATADIILKMQEADPKSAEEYKKQLKTASAMLEKSSTFEEIGTSTDDLIKAEGTELELISKFSKDVETLRKSTEGGVVSADQIAQVIRGYGPAAFESYRNAHADRALHRGR